MKTSTKILGFLAASIGAAFIFKSVKEKTSLTALDGLNIEINPEKIIKAGIEGLNINPVLKEPAKQIASNIVGGFMQGKYE